MGILANPTLRRVILDSPRTPKDIPGLQLWLEARQGVLSAIGPDTPATYGQGVRRWSDLSGKGNHADQTTGGAQPKAFPWDGVNYLHLPGVSGNVPSMPYATGLNLQGDFDLRARLAPTVWATGGSSQEVLARGTTQFRWYINNGGRFGLGLRQGGSENFLGGAAFGVVPFANNEVGWIRITRVSATGLVTAWYAPDSATMPTVWTSLGTATGVTGDLDANTSSPLFLGGYSSTAELFSGRMLYAEVRNGIDGPVVASFDPSRGNANSSSIVDAQGNTWTINRTGADPACIVSAPFVRFDGTDDFLSLISGLGMLRNVPGATVLALRRYNASGLPRRIWTAEDGVGSLRLTFGADETNVADVRGKRLDTDTNAGVRGGAVSANLWALQTARVDYAAARAANYIDGALSGIEDAFQSSGLTSDIPSNGIYLGKSSGSSGYTAFDLAGVLIFNRALSDRERRICERYLAGLSNGAVTLAA